MNRFKGFCTKHVNKIIVGVLSSVFGVPLVVGAVLTVMYGPAQAETTAPGPATVLVRIWNSGPYGTVDTYSAQVHDASHCRAAIDAILSGFKDQPARVKTLCLDAEGHPVQ